MNLNVSLRYRVTSFLQQMGHVAEVCEYMSEIEFILMILERSDRLSSYKPFCLVEDQSKGECYFKDGRGNKYDAKLIFDKSKEHRDLSSIFRCSLYRLPVY